MRRLQAGFTFIEAGAVIVIIALLAAIMVPRLVAAQNSQSAGATRVGISSLAQQARQIAVSRQIPVTLTVREGTGLGLVQTVLDSATNPGETLESEVDLGSVAFDSSTSLTRFRIQQSDVMQDEWRVTFYPDGSSDRAALEFQQNGRAWTLTVDPYTGNARMSEGPMGEPVDDWWPAGEIERRA